MRLLYVILLFSSLRASPQASNVEPVKLVHYLLDSFTQGQVRLRSGEVSSQKLNYNLITKEMIFEQDGKYLAIAYPGEVDTIYIRNRKFVLVENSFYEWLTGTNYPLFEEFTCKVTEPGVQTGFGTSTTTASVALRSLINLGGAYALKLPDEFQVIPGHSYYIRKNNQYYKIKNEQQVVNLVPAKKQLIKDWVKSKKTNFSKSQDVALLIQQIQD